MTLRSLTTTLTPTMRVVDLDKKHAADLVIEHHYLHRRPPMSFAFGLWHDKQVVGVCTFGVPPSRELQKSACASAPDNVIELNRLWVSDNMPRNTESWFVSRCLKRLPPRIVVSYADTKHGHEGYVYRALSWNYAGWTDMDRKTPRYDYIVVGRHTRSAFRTGAGVESVKVRRKPKHKYWTVTGNRTERRELLKIATWPCYSWHEIQPPAAAGGAA